MPRQPLRRSLLCGAIAALFAVTTACGGPGGESGGTGASGAAGDSAITVGSLGSLSNPAYNVKEQKAALEAAASAVNAKGGLDGRPLKIVYCDTNLQANQEVTCMRELIAKKVSAILAPSIVFDTAGTTFKLAQQANIPVIGAIGILPEEFVNTNVFPLWAGTPGAAYGAAYNLIKAGATRVSDVGLTDATSKLFGDFVSDAVTSAGKTFVRYTPGDLTSDPTLATAAAKAMQDGVDGIVIGATPDALILFVKALQRAGYTGKVASIMSNVTPEVVSSLGPAAEGLLLTSNAAFADDTSNPAIEAYRAAMQKYAPDATLDEVGVQGWSAVNFFVKLMTGATGFTGPDVIAKLNGLSTAVETGSSPPAAFAGVKPGRPDYPRLLVTSVMNGKVENGKQVPDGKGFVDPFSGLRDIGG